MKQPHDVVDRTIVDSKAAREKKQEELVNANP